MTESLAIGQSHRAGDHRSRARVPAAWSAKQTTRPPTGRRLYTSPTGLHHDGSNKARQNPKNPSLRSGSGHRHDLTPTIFPAQPSTDPKPVTIPKSSVTFADQASLLAQAQSQGSALQQRLEDLERQLGEERQSREATRKLLADALASRRKPSAAAASTARAKRGRSGN